MSALAARRVPAPVFESAARTHVGRVRTINEDRTLDRADRAIWAVADGMGGHSAGDVAAEIAITALRRLADGLLPITEMRVLTALQDANRAILAHGDGPVRGTTIVALAIIDDCAHLLWAGDSRIYRLRAGVAQQLTRDHSVVQELIDAGALDSAAARRHPHANVVTRALGAEGDVVIDRMTVDVAAGDRFILCSDGLSGSIGLADLAHAASDPIATGADWLLREALTRDGSDNISIVVVEVVGIAG